MLLASKGSAVKELQKSIEQHLQGVREERAAQAAFEEKVASLRESLLQMERDIGAAPTCGEDEDQVQKNLQMLRERLSFLDREVRETSRSAHERYSERRQGVPEAVEQALASVELLSENVMAALEGKEREFKKARTARADYCEGSKALAAWLQKAQSILQRKGDSPEVTKENLMTLSAELPGVRRDAERRVVQSGNLVVECLGDTEQAKSVRATITSLTDQLTQVESWIRERLGEVEDALEAWARFLELHEAHKTWLDMKELAVAKRQPLNTLAVARQCLSQCQEVNRDMVSGQSQLAEMSSLVQRIGRSCHVGPLLEKLDVAEERQRNLEGRLVQELALLQELVEEWEQCERKARDCQAWLERTRSSLEAPQLRRKSLRDQLALREKMLADLSSQQTKMAMSLEKLRVHLRGWASWAPEENAMVATVQELSQQLQGLQGKLDARCQELSACLAQDEQYSQDLLHVRQLLSQSEHRLKLALGAIGNTPEERTLNLKLQEALKDEVRKYRHQMTQLQDHIRKLHQRQLPDEVPFNLSTDTSYRRYVRSPRGSARPSREATPEPGQASSSMPGFDPKSTPFLQLPRGAHSLPAESQGDFEESAEVPVTLIAPVIHSSAPVTSQEKHAKASTAKSSSKDGSSQQKKAETKAQPSQSVTADSRQAEGSAEDASALKPTYAEILSGRASPQPSSAREPIAVDEPVHHEPKKPHPTKDSKHEEESSATPAVQVPVREEAETSERLNGAAAAPTPPQPVEETVQRDLLSPTGETKRLTYAQVARMGSPVPGYEGAEPRSEDGSGGVRESGGVSKEDAGVVPQRTGTDDESGAGSQEQRQGTPLEETASKKKAKKKRKGLPEEASAREPVGEGGGENAGRHSDGCLDPASKGAAIPSETVLKLSGQALGSFMDVPAGQDYTAYYQSRPQSVVDSRAAPRRDLTGDSHHHQACVSSHRGAEGPATSGDR
ncbi:hypothetical protein V5799_008975 [Amblyomma americanum]|uniref:Uncharacterized protein n=1 Tax=Amblyomma americanum TaxID=6943 RepID=A0AAQ4FCD3_AMBAM